MSSVDLPEGLIGRIELHERLPFDFDFMTASNDRLLKYGLPLPPDKASFPQQHAKWERMLSRSRTYVRPEFKAINQDPVDPTAQLIPGATESHNHTSRNWSGAVADNPGDGYTFVRVVGSWTVSRPHPQNWAWEAWGWNPAKFSAGTWVGIDGYGGSHDVLQAGTAQRCITSTHQDTKYVTFPWYEWYRDPPYEISGFAVSPGDLVTVDIFVKSDTKANIYFLNESACTYTSFDVVAGKDVSLKGNCAEWIVEAHRPKEGHQSMSYLGATFLYDCYAVAEKRTRDDLDRQIKDLDDAIFVDVVQEGVTLSTAVKENKSVLGIFGEKRTESTVIPYVAK